VVVADGEPRRGRIAVTGDLAVSGDGMKPDDHTIHGISQ